MSPNAESNSGRTVGIAGSGAGDGDAGAGDETAALVSVIGALMMAASAEMEAASAGSLSRKPKGATSSSSTSGMAPDGGGVLVGSASVAVDSFLPFARTAGRRMVPVLGFSELGTGSVTGVIVVGSGTGAATAGAGVGTGAGRVLAAGGE